MSWKVGSQDTVTVVRARKGSSIVWVMRKHEAALAKRAAWVIMTPFGSPVEPDVYCKKASVSPVTSREGQSQLSFFSVVSEAMIESVSSCS